VTYGQHVAERVLCTVDRTMADGRSWRPAASTDPDGLSRGRRAVLAAERRSLQSIMGSPNQREPVFTDGVHA
jgi:hypothetical protein